jgi:hypothetical protein
MGLRSNCAAVKVARTLLSKEEYAEDMDQRSNVAAVKDVLILLSKEECALGMEQRSRSTHAAVRGAQI